MNQDKLFMIILVSVFAAGAAFLSALRVVNVGGAQSPAAAEHGHAPVASAEHGH